MTAAVYEWVDLGIRRAPLSGFECWSYIRGVHVRIIACLGAPMEVETSMNVNSAPNVFDAGLPTLNYGLTATPHDILKDVRRAQSCAPIAIGPHGPEILSYALARTYC